MYFLPYKSCNVFHESLMVYHNSSININRYCLMHIFILSNLNIFNIFSINYFSLSCLQPISIFPIYLQYFKIFTQVEYLIINILNFCCQYFHMKFNHKSINNIDSFKKGLRILHFLFLHLSSHNYFDLLPHKQALLLSS